MLKISDCNLDAFDFLVFIELIQADVLETLLDPFILYYFVKYILLEH